MNVYTVYDSKAKYYLKPFITTSKGEAVRQFIAACNDPQHPFFQYAADFTLFELGTFDPQTGRIDTLGTPQETGRAWELKTITIEQHLNEKENPHADE